MGYKVGIPVMKCSLNPSQQINSRTGKAAKTCSVNAAWQEMNDERIGRDETIDRSLTPNNVWMEGSTHDDLPGLVQSEVDRISEERREHGKRGLRKDCVSVIQIIEKPPIEFMQKLSPEEQKKFLEDSHSVMTDLIHDWNKDWKVIASVQHHDEWGGRSPHNHTMVMIPTVDDNGVATMNAKKEVNLAFYNFLNKSYPDRMRAMGYEEIENCRTYDQLTDMEKEERKLNPPEHGKDSYEYKQERKDQLSKELSKLEEKKDSLSKSLIDGKRELGETKREIGDLRKEKNELDEKTKMAVEARNEYTQKILEITKAPDIPTYRAVLEENKSLKEELTLKDRLMENLKETNEKLQETLEHWKAQATEWKDRFADISHKAGQKLMGAFGYDVRDDKTIQPYPSREVSENFKGMQGEIKEMDPKGLRVIPDLDNEGKFRVVHKNSEGGYDTLHGNFDTRQAADSWRKDFSTGAQALSDKMGKEIAFK